MVSKVFLVLDKKNNKKMLAFYKTIPYTLIIKSFDYQTISHCFFFFLPIYFDYQTIKGRGK